MSAERDVTEAVRSARAQIISHACCMEDYGAMGIPEVIERGRAELDALLDAYAAALRASAPATGSGETRCYCADKPVMERVTGDRVDDWEGKRVHYRDTFLRCGACGEEMYTFEMSVDHSLAFARALFLQHGIKWGRPGGSMDRVAARGAFDPPLALRASRVPPEEGDSQ